MLRSVVDDSELITVLEEVLFMISQMDKSGVHLLKISERSLMSILLTRHVQLIVKPFLLIVILSFRASSCEAILA